MVMIIWQLDLQLPMQSVPIITKVVSLNPADGKVYSIQHYVIYMQFVSDLWQVGDFLWGTLVYCMNEAGNHNIAEILLKVVLNTINYKHLSYVHTMYCIFLFRMSTYTCWTCLNPEILQHLLESLKVQGKHQMSQYVCSLFNTSVIFSEKCGAINILILEAKKIGLKKFLLCM